MYLELNQHAYGKTLNQGATRPPEGEGIHRPG